MKFWSLIAFWNTVAALPSFDYTQLDSDSLHEALVQHGMISLRNIPHYAETRREYLLEAARCARGSATSHRRLQDGTERFTISSSKPVCSQEFITLQEELNNIIQKAVVSCGKVLEMKDKTVSNAIETAETLDHFHLYVKPTAKTTTQTASIDFHTDNGLLIAFTTPMLLTENYTPIEMSDDSESGLFVKDPTTNQIVQPHLPPNDLILMIGEGLSQWTGSKSFSPVVHGMTMPEIDEMKQRAWFGKMFLFPENAVMDNTQMTFGSYVNATKRFLMDQGVSDHRMALACPAGRQLVASDNECKRKICKPIAGSDATEKSCNNWCNDEMRFAQVKCNKKCSCDTQNFLGGEMCWMLCLENITCEAPTVQECNEDDRVLECVTGNEPISPSSAPTPAPSDATPAPSDSTPGPSVPTPSTPGGPSPTPTTVAPKNSASSLWPSALVPASILVLKFI